MNPQLYADGTGLYILATGDRDGIAYGRLVNVPDKTVSGETPIQSIAGWCPYSDFKPVTGELPADAKALLDGAGVDT